MLFFIYSLIVKEVLKIDRVRSDRIFQTRDMSIPHRRSGDHISWMFTEDCIPWTNNITDLYLMVWRELFMFLLLRCPSMRGESTMSVSGSMWSETPSTRPTIWRFKPHQWIPRAPIWVWTHSSRFDHVIVHGTLKDLFKPLLTWCHRQWLKGNLRPRIIVMVKGSTSQRRKIWFDSGKPCLICHTLLGTEVGASSATMGWFQGRYPSAVADPVNG